MLLTLKKVLMGNLLLLDYESFKPNNNQLITLGLKSNNFHSLLCILNMRRRKLKGAKQTSPMWTD